MIYILTGIAKSGKTLIANEVIKRISIPLFSTDYIMMMLSRGNKDLGIDVEASDSVVSKQLEPYIEGLLKTIIENKVDYLIEGVHFNPDFAKKLMDHFPHDIKVLFLGYKNIGIKDKEEELLKYKDATENPWYLSHKGKELTKLVSYLIKESTRVYDLCKMYDLDYIEVHNISVQKDDIINKLMKE